MLISIFRASRRGDNLLCLGRRTLGKFSYQHAIKILLNQIIKPGAAAKLQ